MNNKQKQFRPHASHNLFLPSQFAGTNQRVALDKQWKADSKRSAKVGAMRVSAITNFV
jgi:hypothetical protein